MKKTLLALIIFIGVAAAAQAQSASSKDTIAAAASEAAGSVGNLPRTGDYVMLFPNPAHNELNVLFDNSQNVRYISIYNLIGKAVSVYRVTANTSAKLDIANIPSGIYFLRLTDAQGQVTATRKFTHQ